MTFRNPITFSLFQPTLSARATVDPLSLTQEQWIVALVPFTLHHLANSALVAPMKDFCLLQQHLGHALATVFLMKRVENA